MFDFQPGTCFYETQTLYIDIQTLSGGLSLSLEGAVMEIIREIFWCISGNNPAEFEAMQLFHFFTLGSLALKEVRALFFVHYSSLYLETWGCHSLGLNKLVKKLLKDNI